MSFSTVIAQKPLTLPDPMLPEIQEATHHIETIRKWETQSNLLLCAIFFFSASALTSIIAFTGNYKFLVTIPALPGVVAITWCGGILKELNAYLDFRTKSINEEGE